MTVHRRRDDDDVAMLAVGFIERLARFPADVVERACDRWIEREEFFPAWAELRAEIDKLMRGRLALQRAIAS